MILNAALHDSQRRISCVIRCPISVSPPCEGGGRGGFIAALQTQRVARLQRATQVFFTKKIPLTFLHSTQLFIIL